VKLPPHIDLPAVTFLAGGNPRLRTEVANLLADLVRGAQAHSFASPIRDGVLGTFFMGDPAIDIAAIEHMPIFPDDGSPTFRDFIIAFSQFLPAFFADPSIIGRIAARRAEENMEYFSALIFDDADNVANVKRIADLFGRENALIVNFGEPALRSKSIRVLDVAASDPASYIWAIAHALNPSVPLPHSPASSKPPENNLDDLA
jgi:hypothetical protein